MSEELGERKNDLGTFRSLVGYAIRLESNTTKETRLVYATTVSINSMIFFRYLTRVGDCDANARGIQ